MRRRRRRGSEKCDLTNRDRRSCLEKDYDNLSGPTF